MCESVMSRKSPPLMFGADTSRTNPSQKVPSLNSVLKLLRKLNSAVALVTCTPNRSSELSLIPSGSGVKALLGGLSDITVVVTQSPAQPGGRAGAVTLSQFSMQGLGPFGKTLIEVLVPVIEA